MRPRVRFALRSDNEDGVTKPAKPDRDVASPACGQQKVAPPELARMIDAIGGLSSNDLGTVERGGAVAATVALAPADRNEVALVGLVALDVPRAFYLSRTRDLPTFLATPTRSTFELFHGPATASDMSGFTLDESDVAAVAKCRPAHCQMKLPATMMDRLREPASIPVLQTNANVRAWLAGLVNDYRAGGDESLPVYDDTHPGEHSAEGFQHSQRGCFVAARRAPVLGIFERRAAGRHSRIE